MQLELSDLEKLFNRLQQIEQKVKQLEDRVAELENGNRVTEATKPPFPSENVSERYRSLAKYLYDCGDGRVVLTYSRIEEILGFALPATAHNYPQSYWANTETHSYSSGWMAVGYKARVNYEKKLVTFEKNIF